MVENGHSARVNTGPGPGRKETQKIKTRQLFLQLPFNCVSHSLQGAFAWLHCVNSRPTSASHLGIQCSLTSTSLDTQNTEQRRHFHYSGQRENSKEHGQTTTACHSWFNTHWNHWGYGKYQRSFYSRTKGCTKEPGQYCNVMRSRKAPHYIHIHECYERFQHKRCKHKVKRGSIV